MLIFIKIDGTIILIKYKHPIINFDKQLDITMQTKSVKAKYMLEHLDLTKSLLLIIIFAIITS